MDETRIIDRLGSGASRNCVESGLVSWVDAAGEPGRFIEWWWRDEWLDFEAHCDVAEANHGQLRPPPAVPVASAHPLFGR